MTRSSRTAGAISAGALVVVCLVITAVVGVIAGAVWGLSGSRDGGDAAPGSSQTTGSSPSSSGTTAPAPDPSSGSSTPSVTTPPPTATGAVPPAPATTTTSADGWRLGSWKITSTDGTLGVETTARNTTTGTRSADLVLYVYVGGQHIATTTARVTDVPAGGTVPVTFTGPDAWQAGQKVLLLQVG